MNNEFENFVNIEEIHTENERLNKDYVSIMRRTGVGIVAGVLVVGFAVKTIVDLVEVIKLTSEKD